MGVTAFTEYDEPCPWCGDMDNLPISDEALFVECLECKGWFVIFNGHVSLEATAKLAEAQPA